MSIDFSRFVPDVEFKKIPIKNLVSSQDYQRGLSESQILHTADDFDLHQINPVKVSRRDGINYVFDGQHTIEIVALVSGSRETPVWCMIYNDLFYEHEAQVFAEQQKHSRPICPYDKFIAHIEANSQKHLMIKSTVESYGLQISSSQMGPMYICAVSALENIYDKYGYQILDRTLRLCVATWEGELYSLTANMMMGIARLLHAFGDDLQEDAFRDRLGQYTAKSIARTSKERRPGSLGYAETLVIYYNKKSGKNKLNQRKLYGSSSKALIEEDEADSHE